MKHKNLLKTSVFTLVLLFLATPYVEAQTKRLKRPKSRVGIYSVDNFVQNSFDLYDKVYRYDGYAENGTPLSDDDIDILEDALDDLERISTSAADVIADLDGVSVLKQGKATLQINRAKKAPSYSIKTAKKLLTENRKKDDEGETTSENEETEPVDDNSTANGKAQNRRVEFVKM